MRTDRRRRAWLAAFVSLVLAAPVTAQVRDYHPALDEEKFPVPEALVPNIAFWRAIFSEYTSAQTVIHDDRNLDVVFSVVDVSDLVRNGSSSIAIESTARVRVRAEIEKYERIIRRLGGDRRVQVNEADLERVRALYARSARRVTDFGSDVGRVRGQGGLRDRFAEAIQTSGMFMEGIEEALERHDVPREVRCLPFVESMFNYRARSSVGASGVWQFTPSTGRLYLHMDSAVDARSDVLLAADGAARMLADNYERVRSWPLALTGYNHGIAGMERAARQLGTKDMGVIAERYESRTFGFASRNFYAEFLAAFTVYADRETLFPGVEALAPVTFDAFEPGAYVSLLDLAYLTGTDVAQLTALNPALHPDVSRGVLLVPAKYPLRVPSGTEDAFEDALDRLPDSRKRERQLSATYRVRRGDTVGAIARRYGTTPTAIQRANGLSRPDRIYVGQVLEVGTGGSWTPLVWTGTARVTNVQATLSPAPAAHASAGGSEGARTHVVRRGETLTRIAARYGVSVPAIAGANSLRSVNRIRPGMRLDIPD